MWLAAFSKISLGCQDVHQASVDFGCVFANVVFSGGHGTSFWLVVFHMEHSPEHSCRFRFVAVCVFCLWFEGFWDLACNFSDSGCFGWVLYAFCRLGEQGWQMHVRACSGALLAATLAFHLFLVLFALLVQSMH